MYVVQVGSDRLRIRMRYVAREDLVFYRRESVLGIADLKAVAEVAEHEAEQKMLQIEDVEQLEQADDSLSDDDVEGLPLDLRALDDL